MTKTIPSTARLLALTLTILLLASAGTASAGTYLEHQCSAGAPAVSSGWYVYGATTQASTTLSNNCGTGGSLGDNVSSGGLSGAVTEEGTLGSGVVLAVAVPGSAPDDTIKSISAHVTVSAVTGDDAFLEFTSTGQSLPDAAEIVDGGAVYAANDTWTLPENAREFAAAVNCTTDHSHTTCQFATANEVPALNEITLTLIDNVPPTVEASGTLAGAAASNGTVSGAQTVNVTGKDSDSGVQSTTLTLIPHAGGASYTKTFEFACPHESWNACATTNTGEETLQTGALADGAYTVEITTNDAAGNHKTTVLGNITTHNAPTQSVAPSVTPVAQLAVGGLLTAHSGSWSAASEAGAILYSYQWEDCDAQGQVCQAIVGAQSSTYTLAPSDVGHTLRVTVTATDNDGFTTAASPATSVLAAEQGSLGAPTGPGTGSNTGSSGGSGSTGGGSTSAGGGAGGSSTSLSGSSAGGGGATGTGTPNGTIASVSASLRVEGAHVITHSYTRRAVDLKGYLQGVHGEPISGATLEVLQQTAGGTPRLVAYARTRGDGSFTAPVPAGPSRLIEVAYRAYSADPVYAAQATVLERVQAGVKLSVSPHHISPTGMIKLTGRVYGPLPPHGVRVELLVHYHGEWTPLMRPVRTSKTGGFRAAYRFKGARGVFPIHAAVQGDQAGFLYITGTTHNINVGSH